MNFKLLKWLCVICILFFGCSKKTNEVVKTLPSVITGDISNLTSSNVNANGQVVTDGNASIIERGIVIKNTPDPTINDTKVTAGMGVGIFTAAISGLDAGVTYHIRAFATNSVGTSYGLDRSFTTTSTVPILTTSEISSITSNSATGGGNISSDGGSAIKERGICWSISANPTITNNKTSDGAGAGNFNSAISGLALSTKYYVRAYATNNVGTGYGPEVSFTTLGLFKAGSGVVDIDGNQYATIILNNQEWMKENLKVSKYKNGDAIPLVSNTTTWNALTTGAYVYYNNDANNNTLYGKLYNWYAVVDTRGVCPAGWHVPSDAEWTVLSDYLGGLALAGKKMKIVGTDYWTSPNIADNTSGFSAYPNGCRCNPQGDFGGGPQAPNQGLAAVFWTNTSVSTGISWVRQLNNNQESLNRGTNYKYYGMGVRCVKD